MFLRAKYSRVKEDQMLNFPYAHVRTYYSNHEKQTEKHKIQQFGIIFTKRLILTSGAIETKIFIINNLYFLYKSTICLQSWSK